ncbi:MAG: M48 family metallopeptidase [Candidatus Aenigmarchaeota archaeon]|nr:M48 family metallopeptidase [Candidatus Aenigmarchaeota archaeon]
MPIKYPYEFDPKKRNMAKLYSRQRLLMGIANGIIIELLTLLLILLFQANVFLKEALSPLPTLLVVPLYAFFLMTIMNLAKLPLSFYAGYVFEHKYGLSNYTIRGWFKDYMKRQLIGYIIGIITLTAFFYLWSVSSWWLVAGVLYTLFSVFLNYIYPVVLVPFFYKFGPYRNQRHKKKLLALCRMLGVSEIKDVIVVKESEKSKKPNAFFTGFGNTKKIALFDTLTNNFTEDEIETVIGHELGHYVNHDIWRSIAVDAIKIFPVLFIIDKIMHSSVNYFGIAYFGDLAALPLFMLLFSVAELIAMPLANTYSRRREAEADLFALNTVQKAKAQVSTEKRLADLSLGDHRPHPIIEALFHTHPATWRRIKMAREWKKK